MIAITCRQFETGCDQNDRYNLANQHKGQKNLTKFLHYKNVQHVLFIFILLVIPVGRLHFNTSIKL